MQRRIGAFVCAVLAAAVTSSGCGGAAPSLGPSPVLGSDGSTPAGAVIAGQINGGSGLALVTGSTTSAQPLTVTVVGTNISATVDPAGTFTLTGVPAGGVQLQFTGYGANATVTISSVGPDDRIQLAVTVSGTTAVIQAQHRSSSGRVEVTGRVTELDPVARTLRVSGTLVNVPATAAIRHGSRTLVFSDIQVGDKVEVHGTSDGTTVQATEIKVQREHEGPKMEIEGLVSALAGSCPNLTFTVGAAAVRTSGATYFKHAACARVQNGTSVEVKAEQQADGSLVALQLAVEQDEVTVDGTIAALAGSCPALTFTVGGTTVGTDGMTRFDAGTCADVRNGRTAKVRGVRRPDGALLASRVQLAREHVEEARLEGTVSGLAGTCPVLAFVVTGTIVKTEAATRFEDGCAAVQNGRQVDVRGPRQPDGSVLATRLK